VPPVTLAFVLLLLQIPPVTDSIKVIFEPVQTLDKPLMLPASGNGLTKTDLVAKAVPQLLDMAYEIIAVPAVTPVTVPPVTLALVLLLLQAPPPTVSVNSIELPGQMVLVVPEIVPA
jgi:hypothetical protein